MAKTGTANLQIRNLARSDAAKADRALRAADIGVSITSALGRTWLTTDDLGHGHTAPKFVAARRILTDAGLDA